MVEPASVSSGGENEASGTLFTAQIFVVPLSETNTMALQLYATWLITFQD